MKKTQQKPLLTGNIRRQLMGLAAPLLLGNIMQQCYNIADTLIVGRFLGMEAFAAIGVAGTVMNLMIFVLSGFCIGTSVLFAADYGCGDEREFRRELFVMLVFGSVVALGFGGAFRLGLNPLLHLIRTPQELLPQAEAYLTVVIGGVIVTYAYHLLSGVLRALGDTTAALLFLLLAVTVNVALDIFFVGGLALGIRGAAWATVFSQGIAAAGCFLYMKRHYRNLICSRADSGFHWRLVKKTLQFGLASALQESNLYIGKVLIQGAVNGLGTVGIAAYTAATRLEGFANSFGDSGALAISVMISQNDAAGKQERVKEALRQGIWLHVLCSVTISTCMFVFAEPGVMLFLDADNISAIAQAAGYLRVISVFYILCFLGSAFVGYFRGTGRVYVPLVGTTLNITTRVLLVYFVTGKSGITGIAFATGIGWIMVVGYLVFRWKSCYHTKVEFDEREDKRYGEERIFGRV